MTNKSIPDFSAAASCVDARVGKGILPGAVISVAFDGKEVYRYTGGYFNIEKKIPLTDKAVFRLASMTKPITACACMILQDRGMLSVKDKISRYLPSFKKMYVGKIIDGKVTTAAEAAREITIEDVLTHSSGLSSGEVGNAEYPLYGHKAGKGLAETVEGYSRMRLDFSPGSSQMYSPAVALDVVARIVELVSELPYEEFLKKNIFEPLGMTDAAYNLSDEQWSRVPPMYRLNDEATAVTEADYGYKRGFHGFEAGYPGGAAGLFSTADDYVRFAAMLANEGEAYGARILSPQAVEQLRTPHFPIGFAGMHEYFDWGYCVRVVQKKTGGVQELTPGSFGWSGAYNTHFWVDPQRKLSAVYMSNMDNAGGSGAITAFEFECNVMRAIEKAEK